MYMSIVSAKEQQQQQQQYEHELIQVHRNDDENDDEDRNKTMEYIQKDEQKQKQYNDVEIAATIIETDISSITTTADNNNGDDENETNKVSASSSSSSIAETIATTMISNTDTNGTGTSIDCPAISFSDNNPVQQRKNNRISLSKQLGVASHWWRDEESAIQTKGQCTTPYSNISHCYILYVIITVKQLLYR